ncbi:MAG TPA: PEP/pyruvate-binding domain-containing protein [Candidatus Polarisedimenticolaceae bacterium]
MSASATDPAARVVAELSVAMGRPAAVSEAIAELGPSPDPSALEAIGAALRRASGPAAAAAGRALVAIAREAADPAPCLEALFAARDGGVLAAALEAARELAASGRFRTGPRATRALAERLDAEAPEEILGRAAAALGDALRPLWIEGETPGERLLAARLLDLPGEPAAASDARTVLGAAAWSRLRGYLEYTRASHADLAHLAAAGGGTPPVVEGIVRAERSEGEATVRAIAASFGWPGLALGVETRRLDAIRAGSSLPLFVPPEAARILARCPDAAAEGRVLLVTGHGGIAGESPGKAGADDAVSRFRAANLLHAEALREILAVAPLDRARVARLVEATDRIVEAHLGVFDTLDDQSGAIAATWARLRAALDAALSRESDDGPMSAEVTRLVLAFEDPACAADVRTMHGLKRFLHQRGLRLGFRLVKAGRTTNRTVGLAVVAGERVLRRCDAIRYVDFEPDPASRAIPFAVRALAEAYALALLHGRATFPASRVYGYGNEVHYYLTYGSHPAFLRVDWAPPARGGMVDLEFFGVSRYDLENHPARGLEALQHLFRRLDFTVTVEPTTRVHARYDKERARDLGDLVERARALFRLAPYLMDLDWVLGDLALEPAARELAARAWSERFERWGSLPYDRILTSDRLGIVAREEDGPAGREEIRWDGSPPYRDRLHVDAEAPILATLRERCSALGLPPDPIDACAQLPIERGLVEPLESAITRGAVVLDDGEPVRAPTDLRREISPAESFARTLAAGVDAVVESIRLAHVVLPIERALSFRTTGGVNGHEVQSASLPLRECRLWLHVLRDARGLVRLARLSPAPTLALDRPRPVGGWREETGLGATESAKRLRAAGYEPASPEWPSPERERAEAEALIERFSAANPWARTRPLAGERVVPGTAAAPGRAAGRARLGVGSNVEGAVLVVPTLRPEDGPRLATAAGIVATSGAVLSHAGFVAAQWRKPAIVTRGAWPAGTARVDLPAEVVEEDETQVGDFHVSVRRGSGERPVAVGDGDLLVVEGDLGFVRVLGSAPDAIALHEGLRALDAAAHRLASTRDPREALEARGDRLRCRHRLVALLRELRDPILADHAVRECVLAGASTADRGELLAALLSNPEIGPLARIRSRRLASDLARRARDAREEAAIRIPAASSLHEVLALRSRAHALDRALRATAGALAAGGLDSGLAVPDDVAALDPAATHRIEALRAEMLDRLEREPTRHLLRAIERLDALSRAERDPRVGAAAEAIAAADARRAQARHGRFVLPPEDCGLDALADVGGKAANLGEFDSAPWFVVTDAAFRATLAPIEAAVAAIVADVSRGVGARASEVRACFESARLPSAVGEAVARAYASLGSPRVAVRSSALVEDAEDEAHAGEFDTFLGVHGEEEVLAHVKRAWAGLWNERALRARDLGRSHGAAGGGVIVQPLVEATTAGVAQTVNLAADEPGEIVINVALGLGEGVVAGTVPADRIVVVKEGDLERGPLRFRYDVADKRERVVVDRASGRTVRVESLYHQRLRPALEYVELLELVAAVTRLERRFAQPIDVEFAFDRAGLKILQVRPLPAHAALVREALEDCGMTSVDGLAAGRGSTIGP